MDPFFNTINFFNQGMKKMMPMFNKGLKIIRTFKLNKSS